MTLRSPIFRKLLASAFVLIAGTLFALDFYLNRYVAEHEIENVKERLLVEARILAGELAATPGAELGAWAEMAGRRAQARITVIDPGGAVLVDSQHDPETMENHAGRPEVREAVTKGLGASIRRSATLRRDLCYLAIPVDMAGRGGVVLRLAVPLQEVDAPIRAVRWRILGASAVAALGALGVAFLFSRRFTRRVARLRSFAEGLTEARFSETLLVDADDELGSLTRSLGRMAAQLRDLVDQLSLESARRELILASMVEGVLAVDNELRVMFCNRSFVEAVGAAYPVREKLPLVELVRDPGLLALLERVLASGQTVKQRLELPAFENRAFEIQAAPLAAASGRGAVAILHDITDLERLERVRKDFVANVSHELRTPLTAILGYAETLLDGALEDPENNRKFVEIIASHATRLGNIAADLLALSELESGRAPAVSERLSVRSAIESVLRTAETEARRRGVNLLGGDLPEADVVGEKIRFEQALLNLLDNAVKFNRPGGEVRVEAVRTGGNQVRITVADTGTGIPSDELPRIFERFYRVDKARSREVGGTGLGLSIVKHVIERMNGTVTVESQLGKGSTFTVLLPVC